MHDDDLTRLDRHNRALLSRWGSHDPRALGFSDSASQDKRFDVILGRCDFTGKSVLDAGCGYGDLAHRLAGRFRGLQYIGIDQQREYVAAARLRAPRAMAVEFREGDFSTMALPDADIVVASGALSYRATQPRFHEGCVARLFEACGDALLFNLLDAIRLFPSDVIIGHDIAAMERVCRSLADDVTLIRGYLYADVTFVMRRGASRAAPSSAETSSAAFAQP
jgi:SAM-dependent methyltransferase